MWTRTQKHIEGETDRRIDSRAESRGKQFKMQPKERMGEEEEEEEEEEGKNKTSSKVTNETERTKVKKRRTQDNKLKSWRKSRGERGKQILRRTQKKNQDKQFDTISAATPRQNEKEVKKSCCSSRTFFPSIFHASQSCVDDIEHPLARTHTHTHTPMRSNARPSIVLIKNAKPASPQPEPGRRGAGARSPDDPTENRTAAASSSSRRVEQGKRAEGC